MLVTFTEKKKEILEVPESGVGATSVKEMLQHPSSKYSLFSFITKSKLFQPSPPSTFLSQKLVNVCVCGGGCIFKRK